MGPHLLMKTPRCPEMVDCEMVVDFQSFWKCNTIKFIYKWYMMRKGERGREREGEGEQEVEYTHRERDRESEKKRQKYKAHTHTHTIAN